MKLFYSLLLVVVFGVINAQGIEMDYTVNSPSLTLTAQYDSLEVKRGKVFEGGDVNIRLQRTDDEHYANIVFDLSSIQPNPDIHIFDDEYSIKASWVVGIDGDDQFRIVHQDASIIEGVDRSANQDVLILDADEDGTHENPIVKMPKGRLHIGGDIKISATSENQLLISGGDVVPASSIANLGFTHLDLGKDGFTTHWDDVVANDFVTYSLFPEIILAKSNASSLDVLSDINTYLTRDKKAGESTRKMLNPKELMKVFPEALHLHDVQHLPDGTTEIVEIENPGIMYDRFIPLLIEGIQEQKELIDKQTAYIKTIEMRLQKLEGK
ncbi:MAG: hypothetical protein ACI9FN_003050 [Saprospiraceae bacterium]|jgi:hypothetical protein